MPESRWTQGMQETLRSIAEFGSSDLKLPWWHRTSVEQTEDSWHRGSGCADTSVSRPRSRSHSTATSVSHSPDGNPRHDADHDTSRDADHNPSHDAGRCLRHNASRARRGWAAAVGRPGTGGRMWALALVALQPLFYVAKWRASGIHGSGTSPPLLRSQSDDRFTAPPRVPPRGVSIPFGLRPCGPGHHGVRCTRI